jgi:hypothetical protein
MILRPQKAHVRSLGGTTFWNISAIAEFSRCPSPRATPYGPSSMPPNTAASWGPFFRYPSKKPFNPA